MAELIKCPRKSFKNLTDAEFQKYKRRCETGPFSEFAKFFNDLKGIKIYLDNEPVDVYRLFATGFNNAAAIIEGKTKFEPRVKELDTILSL